MSSFFVFLEEEIFVMNHLQNLKIENKEKIFE